MDHLATALGLNRAVIEERLGLMSLGPADRDQLREVRSAAEANADRFIEDLYARLTLTPATAAWFTRPGTIERLKVEQRRYLIELFEAPMDWGYVLRRLHIGVVHHRVRLTPRWYIATCAHFACDHIPLLLASAPNPAAGIERLITLVKTILFDAALVLDAYGMSLEASMRAGSAERSETTTESRSGVDPSPIQSPPSGDAKPPLTRMRLTADDCEERLRFLGIDETATRTLRELEPRFREVMPEMLESFYTVFQRWPTTSRLLEKDVVERLTQQVSAYWLEMVQGIFDRPHAASRTRIGIVHERIGVAPQIYLVGLARQLASLLRAATRGHADPGLAAASVLRAVFYDVSFVLDAYLDARAATVLRSEGYASQLLACLTVGVAVLDNDLRVRSANPALLHLLGVEAGVVRHMHAADLVPDPRVRDILANAARNRPPRETLRVEFGGRRLRVSAVRMTATPEDPTAPPLALLVDDITDLATVAPEVDQVARSLFETVSAVDAVLWEADPRGWILSMISAPVLGLTGLRDVHFLGRAHAWPTRIPSPDRERFLEQCAGLALNQRCTLTHRLNHADGSVRWARSQVVRTGSTLEESVFRGVTLDVTSAFLEEKRRLEAVGRLAGSIAHEFNGLLTVISGNLGLLAEDAREGSLVEIDSAQEAVRRGAVLTRQLQAFAQGAPLRLRPALLNEVIASLEADLRLAAGAGIEIAVETQPELWPCEIDSSLFSGALLNLIANARESMPRGGRVRIGTRNVSAREITPGVEVNRFEDHVEVAITDTGEGMEGETRERAIEPFFSTKAAGSGLGLSVVHGFVRQSHGHLLIESGVNRGTTVRLRFPRFVPVAPRLPAAPASALDVRRILVVDDDVSLARLLQRMLTRRGYAARVAHSPEEARRAVAEETPDALICDVVFEGEALGPALGRELARAIPGLPIIYTSGYTKSSLNLEDDDLFLAKPFTFDDLDVILKWVFREKHPAASRPATNPAPSASDGA